MLDIKKLIVSSIILIVLDFSYLYINQDWYKKETKRSQGSDLKLKWTGVFLRYLTQIIGLNLFIIQRNGSLLESFIFGLIIYGNYIGTNYATINIFDETLAMTDLFKGGLIMMLTTYLTNFFTK
jgi:uncharacterized membrane protein